MDLISKMADLDSFGIDLKLESEEEEILYCRALLSWFNDRGNYESYMIDDKEFGLETEVEGLFTSVVVFIEHSSLRFRLVEGNPYGVVLDVLEFVASYHKDVVKLFSISRGSDSITLNPSKATEQASEEEDSDDWEWI
jgi:hypothetical protein